MTLVYVVIFFVGAEFIRPMFAKEKVETLPTLSSGELFHVNHRALSRATDSDVTDEIDSWLSTQLVEAAQSSEFKQELSKQIQQEIKQVQIGQIVTSEFDRFLASDEFKQVIRKRIDEAVTDAAKRNETSTDVAHAEPEE